MSSTTPHLPDNHDNNTVKKNALELLSEFRTTLGPKANNVKDQTLLKFLHWKPNIKRATERYDAFIQWRKKNTFFFDSDPPILASKDPTLKRLLLSEVFVAPDGLVDKNGNTVLIGRFRNNDMGDGRTPKDIVRMVLYTIDRALEKENTQINGFTVFHDMRGMSPKNFHPAMPKMLLGAIIGNFPLRIQGVYILNAPLFVAAIFKIISVLMPSKLRKRIFFVNDISEIPIDKENLLIEHGGTREFDIKEWVQKLIERENEGTVNSLSEIPL